MTTPDTEEKKSGELSLAMTGAVLAVLSLLAAGGGWLLGMTFGGSVGPAGEASQAATTYTEMIEAEEEKKEEEENAEPIAPQVVKLSPITTNLSYPSESWVRLEVAVVFEGEVDLSLAETIHQDLLAYLRTVSLQQIEGPRGFHHLRDDLKERVVVRSDGRVSNLLFRTFLIE